jgi:hypothetical protein
VSDPRDYIKPSTLGHPAPEPWSGPEPEELLHRALLQPGAKRRGRGIKFQCPGCRKEGHDRHRDNATVWNDGRWGCALDPSHRSAIGEALGAREPSHGEEPVTLASLRRSFFSE